ncbi:family 10 glycosylhydrolase [bacterium]|nr:family 10 glycosylhydrolase [bacterium]
MRRFACRSLALLGVMLMTTVWAEAQIVNGGFEEVGDDGKPAGWIVVPPFQAAAVTDGRPHSGQRAMRLVGDGASHAWRHELPALPTRVYRATGWFRAQGVKLGQGDEKDFARFYFHIHYKDRPYTDASQVYMDLPVGTYDWRRLSVRLVPQVQWPIEKVWVTVVGQFRSGTLDCDDLEFAPVQGGTGASALEWAQGAQPLVLSDMSQCTPAAALTTTTRLKQWKLVPYEAGSLTGKMIWAPSESQAPELTLPLGVKGWHAVYVGLADPASVGCQALLRLTRDPAPTPRSRTMGAVEEAFFKAADLTGQSLHLSRHPLGPGCGVAYVKLVPLTPEEVQTLQSRRSDASRRTLVTTIDGFSFIYSRRCTTREDLRREVEVYRDTDFGTLILQPGGADMTNYPSRVGEMAGQTLEVFGRTGDRQYAEAIRELARQQINPTQVMIGGAHDAGLKVHIAIRPGAWEHSPPLDDFFTSRFYREHPQWRCVDRDGTPVSRMSYAVPEVRAHLVDVLREAVGFGADGACVLYVRGAPFVLYEKPFADLFQKRYNADVQTVDENDPRVLALRAEIMTGFMREIRTMLDGEGRKRGTRLALSAMVLANEADNLKFGLDLRQWVKDGLVDLVMPYLHAGGGAAKEYDMAFFREVCGAAKVPVKPTFIGWSTPDVPSVLRQAVALYDQGADGLTFWDGNSGDENTARWCTLTRLGNVEDARRMSEDAPPTPVWLRFHRLGEVIVDGKYSPNWGY